MKLKAYKTTNTRRVLRITLVSDYLDDNALKEYIRVLDCLTIAPALHISLYVTDIFPLVNVDEYFNYAELMGIDLAILSKEREESFAVLLEILETKYGIEYVEAEK